MIRIGGWELVLAMEETEGARLPLLAFFGPGYSDNSSDSSLTAVRSTDAFAKSWFPRLS